MKILGSMLYSIISTAVVASRNDSYEAVFSDVFFWIAAFLGTGLMLTVERIDPKNKERVTKKRVAFSALASLAIVYLAGTVRASMMSADAFERNHWFYAIVMFLCAIAPELVRLLITESPRAIATGVNRGLKSRAERMFGGSSSADDEDEYSQINNDQNEQ